MRDASENRQRMPEPWELCMERKIRQSRGGKDRFIGTSHFPKAIPCWFSYVRCEDYRAGLHARLSSGMEANVNWRWGLQREDRSKGVWWSSDSTRGWGDETHTYTHIHTHTHISFTCDPDHHANAMLTKRTCNSSLPYSSPHLLTLVLTKFYTFYFLKKSIPKIRYFLSLQHPVT